MHVVHVNLSSKNYTEKLCGSCEYVLEIKQEIKLPIEGEHGQKCMWFV